MQKAFLFAAAAFLILIITIALTPQSERTLTRYYVRDLRTGEKALDAGKEWLLEPGGGLVRRDRATGTVLARHAPAINGEATHAVEWRNLRRVGLLLAPHVAGRELFDVHFGTYEESDFDVLVGPRRASGDGSGTRPPSP